MSQIYFLKHSPSPPSPLTILSKKSLFLYPYLNISDKRINAIFFLKFSGDIGCKFQINTYNVPYGTSVLTLAVIAYERYCAVCKPMSCEDVKQRIKWIIPSTWLISIAIYSPMIYFCGSRVDENNQLSCNCVYRWPTVQTHDIYGMFIFVATYAVPLTAIIAFYFLVIRRLREGPPGESVGNVAAYQSRRGVVKMLLITMVLFFVSWTPYNVLYLLKKFQVDFRRIYKYVCMQE